MLSKETLEILKNIRRLPTLNAKIRGEKIVGEAWFWQTNYGVVCLLDVKNLPKNQFLGVHIHEFGNCDQTDDFLNAGGHYNPNFAPHLFHSGDLPPIYTNDGYALSAFLIDKFNAKEIRGRSIIIHAQADDFTTQPGGNSGKRLACGIIK